jgi:hypothetical protein
MAPSLREQLSSSSEDYYLIQFSYPFPTEVRYRLEEAGVTFYDYVGVAAMYAKVRPQALDALQNAMAEKSIRYVSNIPTQAKVDSNLAAQAAARPETEHAVTVDD